MKKKLTVLALVLVATVVAASAAYSNNAAVIIRDNVCGVLTGTGGVLLTTDTQIVITQSANGNALLRCRVKGVPNPTGQAITYDTNNNPFFPGLACGVAGSSTQDWHQTISASGVATLVCRLN